MKKQNYSNFKTIKKVLSLFLMVFFMNVTWGQAVNITLPRNQVSGFATWTDTDVSGTTYLQLLKNTSISITPAMNFNSYTSESLSFKARTFGGTNSVENTVTVSISVDNGVSWTQISNYTPTTNSLVEQGPIDISSYDGDEVKLRFSVAGTLNNVGIGIDDISIQGIENVNTAPTVSNIVINGLPNTTVQLAGSYDYSDADGDLEGTTTFQWYTATDDSGTGATAILGATDLNFTLTNNELGKYISLGIVPVSDAGISPGVETFSSWVGPVNSAGTPVLTAGLLADFSATCLNTLTVANNFSLSGNNLQSDVTVNSLAGFTFSETENGVYENTLSISPTAEAINTIVYVKFMPTAVQSYNGTITISGGGASDILVDVIAEGINTAVIATTLSATAINATTVTLEGSLSQGCSAISSYGIEYSLTDTFANGTGTMEVSTNLLGSNFSLDLSGLQSNTTYYYKAFATDGTGTLYGTQNSFTTTSLAAPIATTATNITSTGFTANWNTVSDATGYEVDVFEVAAGTNATDLFISEYIEGSSNNKYVEIFNGTGVAVDLSDYQLLAFNNGASSPSNTQDLSGILQNGAVKVYRNSSANLAGTTMYDTGNAIGFNGDDALALYKISTSSNVDVFGRIGNDPGTEWTGDGGYSTLNQTLVRKSSVLGGIVESPTGIGTLAFTTLTTEWDLYDQDTTSDLGSHTFSGGSTATFVINNLSVGNVTSYAVTGLNPNKNYSYVVRATDGASSANSNEIAVTTLAGTTTYENGAWSNGTPTADSDAYIVSDFATTTDLAAKSLTITSGIFTVTSGNTVTVTDAIVNNAGENNFYIQNDGAVLQTTAAVNSGNTTVQRNSSLLYRQDYTLWSSPVAGQNLRNFSPMTLFNRFSSYDTTTDLYTQEIVTNADAASKTFGEGKGYLIRMPNNWPVYDVATPGTSYLGEFNGTLNNGNISVTLNLTGQKYNLVGNPYPSPIAVDAFFSANPNIEKTLYFWRKRNGVPGSGYITYNDLGQTTSGGTPADLQNTIRSGQGFFVQSNTATLLNFTNEMRTATQGTPFFKSANDTSELHRFWLNLSMENTVVGQTLIAYATGATQGVDAGKDAVYFGDSALALTSLIEGSEFAIQGRSVPFTNTDVVPLSFKTDEAATFTISLAEFDGLFSDDQDIFLRDNVTGTLQNLKLDDYTFTTEIGIFNARFEVQYSSTLATNNPVLTTDSILIGVKNQVIKINAGDNVMQKIELIDISGRVIYKLDNVNATTTTIDNLAATNQMLIIRITTASNGTVNQKIIY